MSQTTAPRPSARRDACASVAILSVLLVFVWTAARIHYAFGGNWTAVFCTGAMSPRTAGSECGDVSFPRRRRRWPILPIPGARSISPKRLLPLCGCAAGAFSPASGSAGGLAVRPRTATLDRRRVLCRGDGLPGVGRILVGPVVGAPRPLCALGAPVCGRPRHLGILRPHAGRRRAPGAVRRVSVVLRRGALEPCLVAGNAGCPHARNRSAARRRVGDGSLARSRLAPGRVVCFERRPGGRLVRVPGRASAA